MCGLRDFDLYVFVVLFFFFFKQKTAYEMRISDWSSDVCSSDLAYGCQGYNCQLVSEPAPDLIRGSMVRPRRARGGEGKVRPWMLKQVQHDDVGIAGFALIDRASSRLSLPQKRGDRPTSDARRVGNACVRTCKTLGGPYR